MSDPPSPQVLFQLALEFSVPAERRSFLDRACSGNAALRKEVDALLAAYGAAALQDETAYAPGDDVPAERAGDRIGRYKLLEMIGEGGFGRVWMAEQEQPMRRKVALKIVKLGMDTREVLARFEAERQALALMEHPNIARVFDGGATESGRPYFVMELVRGLPITEFCDARRMPPGDRLELFRKVCLAVQHAHQKGIIHRDLKPSNILVTVQDDQPVAKVIDFGIAKALQSPLTEKTLFTRFNQWLGTPSYMSPEQAGLGGLDVDTRSDVYSLGAVLYELLTGRAPFDERTLREKGYDAILEVLREEDPPKPSTRLTSLPRAELHSVAKARGGTPEKLAHAVKGELDWILLKALERDRSRRYEAANALADDLARYRRGEPIHAAPPSLRYRTGKRIRKHWKGASTAAACVAVLVAATVASVRQAIVAREARDTAVAAMQRADQASDERRRQLQEAASTDRLHAIELIEAGRERDAYAFLARSCEYDPQSTLAAETAVFYLNTLDFARETLVIAGDAEIPRDGIGRSGLLKRAGAKRWVGAVNAAFSPDGRHVLSRSLYDIAHLWDAVNGEMIESIPLPPTPEGTGVARWPDEVVTSVGELRFEWPWDPPSGDPRRISAPDHGSSVEWKDDHLLLHNRDAGDSLVVEPGDAGVTARYDAWIRYAPDALRFARVFGGSEMLLHDTGDGRTLGRFVGHAADVFSARFSANGERLVTTSNDTTIRLWETADRALLAQSTDIGMDQSQFSSSSTGRRYFPAKTLDLRLSSDGRRMIGIAGGLLGTWDASSGELLAKRPQPELGLDAVSPDGSVVLVHPAQEPAALVDVASNETRWTPGTSREPVDTVAFSPKGRQLALHREDGSLEVWDVAEGRHLCTAPEKFPEPAMRFAPDGSRLVLSFTERAAAVVLDARSGAILYPLEADEPGLIRCVSFSPDGTLLATGGADATTRIRQLSDGQLVATLPDDAPQTVLSAEFSPDGTMLATAYWRNDEIKVWDTTRWQLLAHITDSRDTFERVVWSPDSRLITSSADRAQTLCVWEARSGQPVARLERDRPFPRAVAYAPDGKTIVSTAESGGPYIWTAPALTAPVPPWFPDFLRSLVQRELGSDGSLQNLTPSEVSRSLARTDAGAKADSGRYGEIARWFLAPANRRPLRPGMALTRHALADRLVAPAASPDQLRRALDYEPANLPAHYALARYAPTDAAAEFLRNWVRERLPSPVPESLRQRLDALDAAAANTGR